MTGDQRALANSERIGFLGDVHGDTSFLLEALRGLNLKGVKCVVQLGDFGLVWPYLKSGRDLDRVSKVAADYDQTLHFVDGNHEAHSRLSEYPVRDDGLRVVRPNIFHMPRGWRTMLIDGQVLAALGGANSIDRSHRRVNRTWWAEEQITEDDLTNLGQEPVDILVSHDTATPLPALDVALHPEIYESADVEYAAAGREMFTRGFMQAKPTLSLAGHYHRFIDQPQSYGSGSSAFQTRMVVLDQNDAQATSLAILDIRREDLTFASVKSLIQGEG